MKRFATQYGLFLCLQCGKCVAVCPMVKIFDDLSVEYLKQTLGEAANFGELSRAEELLTLCPRCRQYDFGEKVKALTPGSQGVHTQEAQMGESR